MMPGHCESWTLILVRTGSTQARVAVAVKASLKYDVVLKREVSVRAHEPGLKPSDSESLSVWAERNLAALPVARS